MLLKHFCTFSGVDKWMQLSLWRYYYYCTISLVTTTPRSGVFYALERPSCVSHHSKKFNKAWGLKWGCKQRAKYTISWRSVREKELVTIQRIFISTCFYLKWRTTSRYQSLNQDNFKRTSQPFWMSKLRVIILSKKIISSTHTHTYIDRDRV